MSSVRLFPHLSGVCGDHSYHFSPSFPAPASSPVNITVTNVSPTSVSVSWAPPPTEDHNGIIRRFRLQLFEAQRERLQTRSTLATNFLFDSLEENYDYSLTVAADTVDVGPYSEATNFTTPSDSKDIDYKLQSRIAQCGCISVVSKVPDCDQSGLAREV